MFFFRYLLKMQSVAQDRISWGFGKKSNLMSTASNYDNMNTIDVPPPPLQPSGEGVVRGSWWYGRGMIFSIMSIENCLHVYRSHSLTVLPLIRFFWWLDSRGWGWGCRGVDWSFSVFVFSFTKPSLLLSN